MTARKAAVLTGASTCNDSREVAHPDDVSRTMRRGFAQIPHGASYAHLDIHAALALLPPACWTPADQARKPRAGVGGGSSPARARGWPRRMA